jgi:DNA end-binding protein Ku
VSGLRALWKGAITFGLVYIPVRLYTATEKKDVKFRYLHGSCRTPVRYLKWCPTCDREVTQDEIVYGYEYEKGRHVVIEEGDLERLPDAAGKVVDIVDFVSLEEIDPVYFDRTYFLEPANGGVKAYSLLRRAMEDTGRVAVARVVIRTKESLATIRVYQGRALVLETMYWPDEVRSWRGLEGVTEDPALHENELKMANSLVSNLATSFDPAKYTDAYRRAVLDLVHRKIEGGEVHGAPGAPPGKVLDLMEALRASVEMTSHLGAAAP